MVMYFLLAIAVALLVEELSGVSPGGIVSAGYLALLLDRPLLLAATLGVALATWLLVGRAEGVMLLYGRRRLAFAIIASATMKGALLAGVPALDATALGAVGILGFVTPGLVADWSLRQGVVPTLCALGVAVAASGLLRLAVPS